MQKAKVIAITALYLIGALGLHGQIHLCCGHFAGFEWNLSSNETNNQNTNCCKKENCCTTITLDASIDHEHLAGKGMVTIWPILVLTPNSFVPAEIPAIASDQVTHLETYRGPPPIPGKERICLFHHWKIDLLG